MALRRDRRVPVRLGSALTMSAVGVLLACADGERPEDTPESLPALPIEVVEGEQPRAEDYAVLGAVREALWANPRLGRRSVAIEVRRGIVTLTGTANSAEAKQQVLRETASVAGVEKVVDRIQVHDGTPVEDESEAEPHRPTDPTEPPQPTGTP